jgi:hypothetical protein
MGFNIICLNVSSWGDFFTDFFENPYFFHTSTNGYNIFAGEFELICRDFRIAAKGTKTKELYLDQNC